MIPCMILVGHHLNSVFKKSIFLSGLSETGKGGNQYLWSMGALLISFNSNENSIRPLLRAHNPLSKILGVR